MIEWSYAFCIVFGILCGIFLDHIMMYIFLRIDERKEKANENQDN